MATKLSLVFVVVLSFCGSSSAQTSSFTYQGKLVDSGSPATGMYDMQFKLFNDPSAGAQQGGTLTVEDVVVTNGVFTVQLDFGASSFPGASRFLDIGVRPGASTGSFTPLTPRQAVNSAPYSVKSLNADTAANATQLNGVAASQYVQTSDTRLTDARNPLPNSANYIQNTSSPQASSNFNISGNGTAGGTISGGIVNATNYFSLGGGRAFQITGPFNDGIINITATNTFAGEKAGLNTSPHPTLNNDFGKFNTFVGAAAGQQNTVGRYNTFFGARSGAATDFGAYNAFFGAKAGQSNTDGTANSFFGYLAGQANVSGIASSFFGQAAGLNSTASNNTMIGGANAGMNTTTGDQNTFVGSGAAGLNAGGSQNTLVGSGAFIGSSSLTNATSIGANSRVSQSNSLVLGSASEYGYPDINVGIGTATPKSQLHIKGNSGSFAITFTNSANTVGRRGYRLSFDNDRFTFQRADDSGNFAENHVAIDQLTGNMGIGTTTPGSKLYVNGSGIVRTAINSDSNAGVLLALGGQPKWSVATVSPGQFQIYNDAIAANAFWIDPATNNVGIGTTGPADKLDVNGVIRMSALGSAGGTQLCRNISNQISNCSSSLRYKTNISCFDSGLSLIKRFAPIAFNWKHGGMRDLGLGAEDVEKIEPRLVTYNDRGEVEGVKYDRVGVVLINAVKEQQAEIEDLRKQIGNQGRTIKEKDEKLTRLQNELEALRSLVCKSKRAMVCRSKR